MVDIIAPYGKRRGYCCRKKEAAMQDGLGLKRRTGPKSAARRRVIFGRNGLSGNSYVLLLGLKVGQTPELLKRIKEGLGYSSWESFIRNTDLRKEDAITFVQISPRTLSRRKEEGRLHPDESDRLIRAARIFALASELFDGDVDSARRWLTRAQPALGGSAPIEYASTEVGAREVEALIGRLEHGIPS
jgi:putative toxin-antitoxin system antitoxin component (TIGR02293 family)